MLGSHAITTMGFAVKSAGAAAGLRIPASLILVPGVCPLAMVIGCGAGLLLEYFAQSPSICKERHGWLSQGAAFVAANFLTGAYLGFSWVVISTILIPLTFGLPCLIGLGVVSLTDLLSSVLSTTVVKPSVSENAASLLDTAAEIPRWVAFASIVFLLANYLFPFASASLVAVAACIAGASCITADAIDSAKDALQIRERGSIFKAPIAANKSFAASLVSGLFLVR